MVQVLTREWEMSKMFIYDVALKDGIIRLEWDDFEKSASVSRPVVAVKVDEPHDVSTLTNLAIDEVERHMKGKLSNLIVVILFKNGQDLMMEELNGMGENLARLVDDNVSTRWGVQQVEDITNDRCMMLFAFEKQ